MMLSGIVYFDGQKVTRNGGLAQLVERVLSMHEVGRSIRPFSISYLLFRHSDIASTTAFIALTSLRLELAGKRAGSRPGGQPGCLAAWLVWGIISPVVSEVLQEKLQLLALEIDVKVKTRETS